ncbi:MAG: LysR substrate-binding domain-containing protein, partial [Acidimicrobiales bacterium]
KVCHVSQPALSAQIRELEARLGAQLFERTSRGVLLTPIGEEVLARAQRVLGEVGALREVAQHAGDELVGPLRLGVIPTVAPYVLPTAIGRIVSAHPGVELYLREDRTESLLAQLQAGDLDFLLLALPLTRPGVDELALYEEPFVLAVPAGHPLARNRRCDISALAGERLVLLEEGHCLRDQALAVCELAGDRSRAEVQGASLGTVVQMVGAGLGVTLLPASAVRRDVPENGSVVVRSLRKPAPTRTIGIAWRSSSACADAYGLIGQLIKDAAQTEDWLPVVS